MSALDLSYLNELFTYSISGPSWLWSYGS